MKKILISLSFLLVLSFVFSQNKNEKVLSELAIDLCNCSKSYVNDLNPKLRAFIKDMTIDSQKAQENFANVLMSLNEDEQAKMMEDITKMQSDEFSNKISGCSDSVKNDLKYKDTELDKISEEQQISIMIKALEKDSSCETFKNLMILGLNKKK